MKKITNTPIDCDVFCTKDFFFGSDVVITGNFYAFNAEIAVASIETGGDIIVDSPYPVCSSSLLSLGRIELVAPLATIPYVYAEESYHAYFKLEDSSFDPTYDDDLAYFEKFGFDR